MTHTLVSPSAAAQKFPTVLGVETFITLHDGREVRVRQLNNAATTPPFKSTMEAVNSFLETYGALHRGAGPRARLTCERVEQAIRSIREFLNCADSQALVFTQNTSAAINLLARMLRLGSDDVGITSEIEHTSNNLPWRYNTAAKVLEIRAFDTGEIDYEDLVQKCREYGERVKIVAVSGASNQTGYIPDLKLMSRIAHSCGAMFFVDAAQLAPHRPIDMVADGIDALAFSAHKLYAPFGLGVLVLSQKVLDAMPVDPGGGSIDMISDREVLWAPPAERHQTGTWNATGIVALGASCETMMRAGWNLILEHEEELVEYTAQKLAAIPDLNMYVPPELYTRDNRIGTFPFNLEGLHHSLVAAILEHEHGIEVRAGTICNHRLVRRWLRTSDSDQETLESKIRQGDRLATYGIVRVSLGIHNTKEDIDHLAEALTGIVTKGYQLEYKPMPAHETFEPVGS